MVSTGSMQKGLLAPRHPGTRCLALGMLLQKLDGTHLCEQVGASVPNLGRQALDEALRGP
eukprot:6997833-Pyramimonas_sp.AAC.1